MSEPANERRLDFIVIGVQKGGTTSLCSYLGCHPQIALREEAPLFCVPQEGDVQTLLASFMRDYFDDASQGTRLGKIAAHYMLGLDTVDVDRIAERIAQALPDVRLIALLREPIARAMSNYRMAVRRDLERRSFDQAVEDLLEPDQLEQGRRRPNPTNSYLVQGEYFRILSSYFNRFPADRIHVELTANLDREPGAVIDRVLSFLGLPPGFRPEDLGVHRHVGGTRKRIDAAGGAELRAFFDERVLPELGDGAERVRSAFHFFLETWDVIPDDRLPSLSDTNRARLETHYRADGERLVELDIAAPWLGGWDFAERFEAQDG